jgi:hypothetical protein
MQNRGKNSTVPECWNGIARESCGKVGVIRCIGVALPCLPAAALRFLLPHYLYCILVMYLELLFDFRLAFEKNFCPFFSAFFFIKS